MVPLFVNMLDVCSNTTAHCLVADVLALVKRYVGTPGVYYPVDETVPLAGVVRLMWRDLVLVVFMLIPSYLNWSAPRSIRKEEVLFYYLSDTKFRTMRGGSHSLQNIRFGPFS
jgi:hypothetical protein